MASQPLFSLENVPLAAREDTDVRSASTLPVRGAPSARLGLQLGKFAKEKKQRRLRRRLLGCTAATGLHGVRLLDL